MSPTAIKIPKFYQAFQRVRGNAPEMVKLNPSQNEIWEQTRAAMLSQAPHLAHLFYTLMNPRNSGHVAYFTPEVPIAATDGVNLFLNPATALDRKTYSVGNRVFMCGHEIFHNVFNHMGVMFMLKRRGYILYPDGVKLPYFHEAANIAMDYQINALMIESKIGVYHKSWLYDQTMSAKGEESWVDIYRKLFESGRVKIVKLPPQPCNGGAGGKGEEDEKGEKGDGNQQGGGKGGKGDRRRGSRGRRDRRHRRPGRLRRAHGAGHGRGQGAGGGGRRAQRAAVADGSGGRHGRRRGSGLAASEPEEDLLAGARAEGRLERPDPRTRDAGRGH